MGNLILILNPHWVDGGVFQHHIVVATFYMSLAATLLTTFLIAERIHSVTREQSPSRTKRQLTNVMELLIQSAAAYSLMTNCMGVKKERSQVCLPRRYVYLKCSRPFSGMREQSCVESATVSPRRDILASERITSRSQIARFRH